MSLNEMEERRRGRGGERIRRQATKEQTFLMFDLSLFPVLLSDMSVLHISLARISRYCLCPALYYQDAFPTLPM